MSEEEIIKICRLLCGEVNKKGEREFKTFHRLQMQQDYSVEEMYQAIEGILDLYNEEKEKNTTLENLLQGNLYEMYLYYKELAGKYQANCVSKDKIREIIYPSPDNYIPVEVQMSEMYRKLEKLLKESE